MKISIIVLVCVSSILYIKTVEGQFDGLVNTVHNAASTLGKGLGGILIPKRNKGAGDNKDVGKPDDDNMKISTPTFPTEASPKADTPESPKADTPASPATTPKTSASVKPDEQKGEGKENFAGGCLAGYKKTADGRCMPTF